MRKLNCILLSVTCAALLTGCQSGVDKVREAKVVAGDPLTWGKLFDTYNEAKDILWEDVDDKRLGNLVKIKVDYSFPEDYKEWATTLYVNMRKNLNAEIARQGSVAKTSLKNIAIELQQDNKNLQLAKNDNDTSAIKSAENSLRLHKEWNCEYTKKKELASNYDVKWSGYVNSITDTFTFVPPSEDVNLKVMGCSTKVCYSNGECVEENNKTNVCVNKLEDIRNQKNVAKKVSEQDMYDQYYAKIIEFEKLTGGACSPTGDYRVPSTVNFMHIFDPRD